ncbi:MAG: hypothetical protein NTU90_07020, partial [Proteobacteria bacterium]|nr:hypothetical protein [Pseudomonadota bacterium]
DYGILMTGRPGVLQEARHPSIKTSYLYLYPHIKKKGFRVWHIFTGDSPMNRPKSSLSGIWDKELRKNVYPRNPGHSHKEIFPLIRKYQAFLLPGLA